MQKKDVKVLIVEDEPATLRAMVDQFTEEGFTVFEAKDGEEALKIATEQLPDVGLFDIMLPKMDGITVVQKLREKPETRALKVLFITQLPLDDRRLQQIIEQGAAYYLLKKDWTLTEMVEKVEALLGM
ncbi:MAG: response regulator [bacterium]|nr:response regulator [bacterium]